MFKGMFFSSKKSGSSSPDGPNSPGSLGSNSPVRSEKKKVKSTKEDSQTASVGIGSLRSGSYQRTQVKDCPKKKDVKNKECTNPQLAQVNGHPKPSSPTTAASKSTLKPRGATTTKEVRSSSVEAAASPISASSLGLNRIKTRSGPLPQESFFNFRAGAGSDKGSGLGGSGLSKLGVNGCSSAGSSSVSVSVSTPASGDNDCERRVCLHGTKGNENWVDKRSNCNTDSLSTESAQSIVQTPILPVRSHLQNGVSSTEAGWHNMSCVHSEELRSSNVCTPDIPFDCENPRESESPRFQAVLRVTSAPRKRFPTDIKSFSHELNSKGVRPYPFWKPRGLNNLQEVLVGIRAKFDKAKEEVNTDLATFAGELVGILEKNAENHPDWQETIEDLLVLARSSALMSPGEFWIQCEGIVQDLDDKRQELPMGMLKHLHTRMLFILTRCTRLLQFHKESGLAEDVNVLQLRQSRILRSADKRIPPTGKNVQAKSYSQEHGLEWKRDSGNILSPLVGDTPKTLDSTSSRDRISSWKQLPSPLAKPTKESVPSKMQNERKHDPLNISDMIPNEPPLLCSPTMVSHVLSSVPSKHQHKVSWGYWGDSANISDDNSIICRICEEEVPTLQVEDHSRICALADRCDQKGLSVDERLLRVAETLDKMIEFSQKDIQHATGSPNIAKVLNSNLTEELDVLSPKYSDWSRRGSEDMLDCLPEADNSMFMDECKFLPSMSFKNRFGAKSDQGMTTSSGGSMTPRSPLMTPRTSQIDLLLAGKYSEHDDHPQMNELSDIARCVAKAPLDENCCISYLLSCLEDLSSVIERRKSDALTVETFGTRIEKLIREKYLQLCELVDDEKVDFSSTIIDEDSPLEDDIVRSLRASPSHPASKDRTSIDDFEIIKPISRGAFGRVFLAKKRTTGDLFAIKVLRKADMIRKNAVESILAERDILISVRNPFVVRFFYSFTCRDNLYLVMEYLNGGDLYSLLRNLGCLDEEVARVYIAEVVLALDYLHSLNVVHRDLKPDNLLIAHDGHIKLTDFGLSRVGLINSTDDLSGPAVIGTSLLGEDEHQLPASDNHRERRKKRSAVGTPDYLAPEILLGTGHGATADWWSVGVILFEMIVGIPPFNAEHPEIIFDNIVNRKILWPRIPDEMSEEAQDLINRLLTEDPQQRLGAKGAPEVKEHAYFKNINWDTLARQKAAFVPASESCHDTSYFRSRYSWNGMDERAYEAEELSDNGSSSSSCLSNRQDELNDECGGLTEFDSGSSVNYSFSNFSFKNLSQLASINYDLLTKGWKDEDLSAHNLGPS